MTTTDAQGARAPRRARMVFLVAAIALSVAVIVSTGLEWGSLSVRHMLVVSEAGTGEWQGVVALVAAGLGLALVPASCMRIHTDNLLFKPLSEPLSVKPEIHLCWNRESESLLVDGFLGTIQVVASMEYDGPVTPTNKC